jgi:hypothetical protein
MAWCWSRPTTAVDDDALRGASEIKSIEDKIITIGSGRAQPKGITQIPINEKKG